MKCIRFFCVRLGILFFFASTATMGSWAQEKTEIPILQVIEERYNDDDLALVMPDRIELYCESSAVTPWGCCFPAFQTEWRNVLELEVSGSGDYGVHDIFSIAAFSLDYGRTDGWIERSYFGLGLIQESRKANLPLYGVGQAGRYIMRGNLMEAKPTPQRITIDPKQYAPQDWDGRLWIGLQLHNTGAKRWLQARIVNALPAGGALGPERGPLEKWDLMRQHQRAFVETALDHVKAQRGLLAGASVPDELKPFVERDDASRFERRCDGLFQVLAGKPLEAGVFSRFEQEVLAQHENGFADTVAPMQNCLDKWATSGKFGKEIGCILRVASNLEKIGHANLTAGQVVADPPVPAVLYAARNEHEGFQIVLSPLPGCVSKVQVSVSDLVGTRGRIAASNATINAIGYVRTSGDFPRLFPDPLLAGPIPDLKPGENQPVWISFHIPDDTPKGLYEGHVLLCADAGDPLRIPISVNVWDFAIPHQFSLRSSFWMFRDQINRFYHLDEVKFEDYLKWIDLALAHRLCPIDVYEGRTVPLLEVGQDVANPKSGVPNPSPDFAKWDQYLDHMVSGGASTLHLTQSHHYGNWFADTQAPLGSTTHLDRLKQSLRILQDHYKQRGIFNLHYVQLRDETSEPDALNIYREVHTAFPELKLLLTAPSNEARPFLRIPCPLTPSLDAAWRDALKSEGGEYWWYVCCGPQEPYANFFLRQRATEHRALFWQTWCHGVQGILYWGLNVWTGFNYEWPRDIRWAKDRVPPDDAPDIPMPQPDGDGFSMYPGPTPGDPLSSIRLEVMRDGEEDYEYLVLLDQLIARAQEKGVPADLFSEAAATRDAARSLGTDLQHFEREPAPYQQVRQRLGDAIEHLSAAVSR